MRMESNSLSINRKTPRYIMNNSDNQNLTYRMIIIVSKVNDD